MRIGAATRLVHASRNAEAARAKVAAKRNKLLVDKLAKSISVTAASGVQDARLNSARRAPLDRNSALERISRLVEFIQSQSLQGSDSDEQAVDEALQEIGQLIGMPVRPGGSSRAVVSGINTQQIESYDVISLRPNARVTLSGTIHSGRNTTIEKDLGVRGPSGWRIVTTDVTGLNQTQIATLNAGLLQPGSEVAVSGSLDWAPASAELIYEGVGGALASGTASFRIIGPNGNKNFSITAGEPLSDIAQRINDE